MSRSNVHTAPLHDKEMIPRALMRAVALLVVTILLLVTVARLTDRPLAAVPPQGDVVASRDLVLSGDMAGRASVHAPDGTLIVELNSLST